MYTVTKTYGHEQGLSVAFRQWRANGTHCRFIHGYAIKVSLKFVGQTLDDRNWLISFGELKEVKEYLAANFDHKTCVAQDDPALATFIALDEAGLIQLNIVPDVGMEKFAELIYNNVVRILKDKLQKNNVRLAEVQVWEHPGNSASYVGSHQDPDPQVEAAISNPKHAVTDPQTAIAGYFKFDWTGLDRASTIQ